MDAPEVGLRERTRRAVRAELVAIALNLFLTRGFEETTVEQIATAAGLSRRSYFRYFASKDDVFAEVLASTGRGIAAALTARPAEETAWLALRRSFDPLMGEIADDERARAMSRMMLENPALHSSHLHKQSMWRAAMAEALAPRLVGGDDVQIRAEALAGAALACLATAQVQWVRQDNAASLDALLDVTMGAIGPLVDLTAR